MQIEPYASRHLDAIIWLSLRAWTPVFESIQNAMNAEVYQAFYSDDWRVSQQKAIEEVCAAEDPMYELLSMLAQLWVLCCKTAFGSRHG